MKANSIRSIFDLTYKGGGELSNPKLGESISLSRYNIEGLLYPTTGG